MNKKDENLFKRFLQNHGMNTMFAGMYNQYKYEDNPETVQAYLEQVPRNLAIAYAFDVTKISPDNPHGAKYWNDLDQQWRKFIGKSDDGSVGEPDTFVDFPHLLVGQHIDAETRPGENEMMNDGKSLMPEPVIAVEGYDEIAGCSSYRGISGRIGSPVFRKTDDREVGMPISIFIQ